MATEVGALLEELRFVICFQNSYISLSDCGFRRLGAYAPTIVLGEKLTDLEQLNRLSPSEFRAMVDRVGIKLGESRKLMKSIGMSLESHRLVQTVDSMPAIDESANEFGVNVEDFLQDLKFVFKYLPQ